MYIYQTYYTYAEASVHVVPVTAAGLTDVEARSWRISICCRPFGAGYAKTPAIAAK